MNKSIKYLPYAAWSLGLVVSALAIIVWGQTFAWHLSVVNSYLFFPVLGLLAFSLMWTHYMIAFARRLTGSDVPLKNYFRYTGYVVLLAIVFHPGILIYQRFRDGYGLPPGSYESYVAPMVKWVTLLGTVSLFVFLAFEFKRFFGDKSWWKYVANASDVAMLAIFYHGLRLGDQLHSGWYKYVWYFYGLTLITAIIYKYISQSKNREVGSVG